MKELTDYQKGMIDAVCGVIKLILEECDEPSRKIIFEEIEKLRPLSN